MPTNCKYTFTYKRIYTLMVTGALSLALPLLSQCRAWASEPGAHYAGVEYFGSSQVTKLELERLLGLKPGASTGAMEAAVKRLSKKLDSRHLNANVEMVSASEQDVYVVVDVTDSGTDLVPSRLLQQPRHVQVTTEKPFLLLNDLNNRLDRLKAEDRSVTDKLHKNGTIGFSDEPCNAIASDIKRYAPGMKDELLAVIASDTDARRRVQAIELLNWAGDVPAVAQRLIDALDDSEPSVRAAATRYLFRRLDMLPDKGFDWGHLAEALSRQINRPSHEDRAKGLYCLLKLCELHPQVVPAIRQADEKRIKELDEFSVIPSVKTPAERLLAMFAAEPAAKPKLPWLK